MEKVRYVLIKFWNMYRLFRNIALLIVRDIIYVQKEKGGLSNGY